MSGRVRIVEVRPRDGPQNEKTPDRISFGRPTSRLRLD
jgi:hypothetical protein